MFSLLGVPVGAAYYVVSGFTGFLTPVLGGLARACRNPLKYQRG